ncbi:MAG: S8 family serine peptidase [Ignavibacteria bacterium]|nr:S8 family serine peptidase [Ignavibacteria bacterium]
MKKLLFILVLLTYSNIFAVDYYYYQNQRIDLQQRVDRVAVVLKNTTKSKIEIENSLKSRLSSDAKILETGFNTYEIKFDSYKLPTELMSISNSFSNFEFVKFVTPTYYGDSRSVIQIPTDEFIVRLKNEKDFDKFQMLNSENKVFIVGNVSDKKGFLLKTYDDVTLNALDLSNNYFNQGLFEYCEPNFIYPEGCLLNYWPNDPLIGGQWHLSNGGQTVSTGGNATFDQFTSPGILDADMNLSAAWDITRGNANITVGVFDTGIDSAHPDLRTNVLRGYDAVWNKIGVPRDSANHGTCTAGLIGARGDNGVGVSGVAPLCKIQSFRIFDKFSNTSDIVIVRAFDSARVWGVEVLSNSWGGGTPSNAKTNAINAAADNGRNGRGCAILFSSGNEGRSKVNYPSYLPKVLSIGATTNRDKRKAPGTGEQYWWGGNFGSDANGELDLCAPTICLTTDVQGIGGYNTTAGANGDYDSTFNGTSCSCPNAAGVAALLVSLNSNLTRLEVYEYLCRGAEKVDRVTYNGFKTYGWWNAYYGYGRVNAYNSLKLAQGIDVVPPAIIYDPISSTTSTKYTRISASFLDEDGLTPVPTEGPNQPVLFYRVKRGNAGWGVLSSVYADSVTILGGRIFHLPGFGWNTQVKYFFVVRDEAGNATFYPKHCRINAAEGLLDAYYYAVGQQQTVTGRISNFNGPTAGGFYSAVTNLTNSQLPILDTKLRVYGNHLNGAADIDDVNLQLVSPNMNSYENRFSVFGRYAGTGVINGPSFYDGANNYMSSGNAPFTNSNFKPDYPFESLNGTNADGFWKFIAYDQATDGAGGPANNMRYDSLRITMTVLSAATSPAFVHQSPRDTIIDFGAVGLGQIEEVNFYIKNNGTDTLNILGNPVISGADAAKFLILFAPTRVMPNDSNVFVIRCSHPPGGKIKADENLLDNPQRATLRFRTDSPDHDTVFVSLQTANPLPVELANFTASVNKKDVELKWATVSELNNSGFDIERKDNLEWKKVSFIQGNGTTNNQKEYSFTDRNLQSGKYSYRLKQIDYNGNFEYYELKSEVTVGIPQKYFLSQNYPNPFNPTTKIDYELPFDSQVKIRIYDMTGREVAALVNGMTSAGYYTAQFNASSMASGIYFCSIEAADNNSNNKFSKVVKMSLIK